MGNELVRPEYRTTTASTSTTTEDDYYEYYNNNYNVEDQLHNYSHPESVGSHSDIIGAMMQHNNNAIKRKGSDLSNDISELTKQTITTFDNDTSKEADNSSNRNCSITEEQPHHTIELTKAPVCDHPEQNDEEEESTESQSVSNDEDMAVESLSQDIDNDTITDAVVGYRDYSKVPKPNKDDVDAVENKKRKRRLHDGERRIRFPQKLHTILSKPEYEDIICWLPHGRSWKLLNPTAFEKLVLPKYFLHGSNPSFIRQVNGWGFRRVTYHQYYHEMFLRGMPHVSEKMKRLTKKGMGKRRKEGNIATPDFHKFCIEHPIRVNNDNIDVSKDNKIVTDQVSPIDNNNNNNQKKEIIIKEQNDNSVVYDKQKTKSMTIIDHLRHHTNHKKGNVNGSTTNMNDNDENAKNDLIMSIITTKCSRRSRQNGSMFNKTREEVIMERKKEFEAVKQQMMLLKAKS